MIRDTDVLARLGGDEFGVLLKYCDPRNARAVVQPLCQALKDFKFVCGGITAACFEAWVVISPWTTSAAA